MRCEGKVWGWGQVQGEGVALPGAGRVAQGQQRGDAHQPGVGGSVGLGRQIYDR